MLLLICISHLLTHNSAPPHRSSGFLLYVWARVAGPPYCSPQARCGPVFTTRDDVGCVCFDRVTRRYFWAGDSIGSSASVTVGVNEAVYYWQGCGPKSPIHVFDILILFLTNYSYCYFCFHYCIQPTNIYGNMSYCYIPGIVLMLRDLLNPLGILTVSVTTF